MRAIRQWHGQNGLTRVVAVHGQVVTDCPASFHVETNLMKSVTSRKPGQNGQFQAPFQNDDLVIMELSEMVLGLSRFKILTKDNFYCYTIILVAWGEYCAPKSVFNASCEHLVVIVISSRLDC
jgi:hypothetical protein